MNEKEEMEFFPQLFFIQARIARTNTGKGEDVEEEVETGCKSLLIYYQESQ